MFKLLKNLTKKDYALILVSTLLIVFQVYLDLKLRIIWLILQL